MEKKINPNLKFVRPEHYNQMLEEFVREQEKKMGENTLYVVLVHEIAFVVSYLCSVSWCPNVFTHLRPLIYFQ